MGRFTRHHQHVKEIRREKVRESVLVHVKFTETVNLNNLKYF